MSWGGHSDCPDLLLIKSGDLIVGCLSVFVLYWNYLMKKSNSKLTSIFIKLLFCSIVYGIILFNFLLNRQDAVWNGTYFNAGDWELSLGRWAIRYLDNIHHGIAVHPYTSIVTLLFFILGTCALTDIFEIEAGSIKDYLVSFLFLANMVVCIAISYLYTSGIYGISFFLSIAIVLTIVKVTKTSNDKLFNRQSILLCVLGAFMIALMMGLYQAYLGCTLEVLVVYLVALLCNGKSKEKIKKYIIYSACTLFSGALLYVIILKIELFRYHMTMGEYNGANSLSISNIFVNLKQSLPITYIFSYNYLNGLFYKWNIYSGKLVFILFIVICLMVLTFGYKKTGSIKRIVASAGLICTVPIAANIVVILIPNSNYLEQQTGPLALLFPLEISLLFYIIKDTNIDFSKNRIFYYVTVFCSCVLIHGSIYQTLIDEEALRQGTVAVKTLSEMVVSELCNRDLYSPWRKYAIIGSPRYNDSVYYNRIYEESNVYAHILGGYWGNYLDSRTWNGIFNNLCGINLPQCDEVLYEELMNSEEVISMPCFPDDGGIMEIGEIIVIKISGV